MSGTLDRVKACVAAGQVRVSRHGGQELDDDRIGMNDLLDGVVRADLVEDYSTAQRGPSVLALQRLGDGQPVHVVWAFHKDSASPAVLVTAYRPDPAFWSPGLHAEAMMTRRVATEWVHEGGYAAAVSVEIEYSDDVWSPTLSLDDARKLERVRQAMRRGDHAAAAREARVFELLPLAG